MPPAVPGLQTLPLTPPAITVISLLVAAVAVLALFINFASRASPHTAPHPGKAPGSTNPTTTSMETMPETSPVPNQLQLWAQTKTDCPQPPPPPPKPRDCRQTKHPALYAKPQSPSAHRARPSTPERLTGSFIDTRTVCRNWSAQGRCRHGDACRYVYSHVQAAAPVNSAAGSPTSPLTRSTTVTAAQLSATRSKEPSAAQLPSRRPHLAKGPEVAANRNFAGRRSAPVA